ncbi:MAG: hypothetical protein AAB091_05225, partial [Elusimicrobiota bacterium]
EVMSHRVSARMVYDINGQWAIKPLIGARYEMLKETKDEQWLKGLFDYRKAELGLELERELAKDRSLRFTYSFFPLWFINYESLESQSTLGRELAGKKPLNTHNNYLSVTWEMPWFERSVISLGALALGRFYPDQRIVEESGNYSSTMRRDATGSANVAARRAVPLSETKGLVFSGALEFALNRSNQNHLDANQSRFIPNYYDYRDQTASLGMQFFWGSDLKRAKTLGLSGWASRRQYLKRNIQDAGGNYLDPTTRFNNIGFSLSGTWPVGDRGLALRSLVQGVWQNSNMKYEANYRYNFSTFNYLFGFSYQF